MTANSSPEHVAALDGVRGFAVLAVIAFHARMVFRTTGEMPWAVFQVVSQGRLGVTLFFVLSGFLITGILLDSRGAPGYFRRFYLRRVLRVFPLYFVYLFLIFVVVRGVWALAAGGDPWKTVSPWWYLTYLQNMPAAHAKGWRWARLSPSAGASSARASRDGLRLSRQRARRHSPSSFSPAPCQPGMARFERTANRCSCWSGHASSSRHAPETP